MIQKTNKRYRLLLILNFTIIGILFGITINTALYNISTPAIIKPSDQLQIIKLIQITNPALLDDLESIKYGDNKILFDIIYVNSQGIYVPHKREIIIRPGLFDSDVWFHELAHMIYDTKLTQEERELFKTIHKNATQNCKYDLLTRYEWMSDTNYCNTNNPSMYALKNEKEDWAETFSRYAVGYEMDETRTTFLNQSIRRITKCSRQELRDCIISFS